MYTRKRRSNCKGDAAAVLCQFIYTLCLQHWHWYRGISFCYSTGTRSAMQKRKTTGTGRGTILTWSMASPLMAKLLTDKPNHTLPALHPLVVHYSHTPSQLIKLINRDDKKWLELLAGYFVDAKQSIYC